MPYPSLPGPIPYSLSLTGIPEAEGIGVVWDIGLNGVGYLMSTLDQESPFEYRAYTVGAIPIQKTALDTSDEPGEQSLEGWWARGQHSWHEGAGQKILDSEFSTRFGFWESKGINIWEDGEISLLKDVLTFDSGSGASYQLLTDGGYIFWAEGATINRGADIDTPATSTISPALGNVQDLASDGKYLYACFAPGGAYGIRRESFTTWTSFTKVNNLSPDIMEFCKGRLICGVDNALHEVVDFTSLTDGATAFYTHLYDDWTWTGFTEAGPAIYYAGYAQDRSQLLASHLDTSDLAAGLTIAVPRVVWEAPDGETIHSIKSYLGRFIMIGTSRGVRRASVATAEGDVEVSPLIVETDYPVYDFTFWQDYCWFGWSKFDSTSSGVGRIHLGTLAYASDLMATAQGDVTSIIDFGGRILFAVDTSGIDYVFAEEEDDLVSTGWLDTGEARFGTFENKKVRYWDSRSSGSGTLGLWINNDGVGFVEIFDNMATGQIEEAVDQSGTRFKFKLYLNRDSVDATAGPTVTEWRVRGEPLADGRFRHFVPIMLYDKMKTLNGRPFGYPGYHLEKLEELMDLYRESSVVKFQPPGSNLPQSRGPFYVQVEDLQFKSYTPPSGNFSGVGGICLVVLKEQG